jgi:predicted RNase H-related nuclease YkuK (DUF458 family)
MMNSKKQEYEPFENWKWKTYTGKKYDIDEFIKENNSSKFFIGTDSQNYSKKNGRCVFTTVLIAYEKGRGGKVLTHTDTKPFMSHLRQRLLIEAMRSLECAWYLSSKLPEDNVLTIHLDVNENLRYKSSKYKDELVGMVMGQGFNAVWKPNSWASSSVADSKC